MDQFPVQEYLAGVIDAYKQVDSWHIRLYQKIGQGAGL